MKTQYIKAGNVKLCGRPVVQYRRTLVENAENADFGIEALVQTERDGKCWWGLSLTDAETIRPLFGDLSNHEPCKQFTETEFYA
jgi:hypothetical protein